MSRKAPVIGVWGLTLLNVAAVLSIVNFPDLAEYGYEIVFYIGLSALCFFIPTALVSAELASAWPENGGLFLWGREAIGPRWGFVNVAMQWLNSLPWYGTVLTFIATTLAYMFAPDLADNRWFIYLVIVTTMWGCTLFNCFGIRLYTIISGAGVLVGTVTPLLVIVGAAVWYLAAGNPPTLKFSVAALMPELDGWNHWMLLAGMMVALAGIDMSALHVTDVKRPGRTFPRAILLASVFIVVASIAGTLAIALVVPPDQLSMASGTGEALAILFDALHISWLTPLICLLLIAGALTTVFTWILGPSKGLLEVAREGCMPVYWSKRNRYAAPTRILVLQATVTSVLALSIFFMPTVGGAFWMMMALSAQLYMTMYMMLFISALVLRLRRPEVARPFRVPGGVAGMAAVCLIGFLTALLALLAGFIPPAGVRAEGVWHGVLYSSLILAGTLFCIGLPVLAARARDKHF